VRRGSFLAQPIDDRPPFVPDPRCFGGADPSFDWTATCTRPPLPTSNAGDGSLRLRALSNRQGWRDARAELEVAYPTAAGAVVARFPEVTLRADSAGYASGFWRADVVAPSGARVLLRIGFANDGLAQDREPDRIRFFDVTVTTERQHLRFVER